MVGRRRARALPPGQPHRARSRHRPPGGDLAGRRDRLPEPRIRRGRPPDRARLRRAPLHGRLLRRLQGDLPRGGGHRVDHALPRREDDRRPAQHVGPAGRQPDAGDHPPQRLARPARLLPQRDAQPEARDHPLLLRAPGRGPRGGLRLLEGDGDGGVRAALPDRGDDELGVPARPEPLPDGQGHVGRGPDRRPRAASSRPRRGATTASRSTATSRSCSSTTPRRARCSTRSRRPGFSLYDQWEAQLLALIRLKARVGLRSELPADEVRRAHLEPIEDIGDAVAGELLRIGADAPVAVLPEGPQTIPYVS